MREDQYFNRNSDGLKGDVFTDDYFGYRLTTGDFNGDGKDDLSIGVPGENTNYTSETHFNTGAVNVIFGSTTGLRTSDNPQTNKNEEDQWWRRKRFSANPFPWPFEFSLASSYYGGSLAAGDFNGDNRDDLAIGWDLTITLGGIYVGEPKEGALNVIYGTNNGLTASDISSTNRNESEFLIHGADLDLAAAPGKNNLWRGGFARSLAVGDFDNDGYDDLAVGAPESFKYINNTVVYDVGDVSVLYGDFHGLTAAKSQYWDQGIDGIKGALESDLFGYSLTVGNFNGDNYDDLAIGAPGESVGDVFGAGAVNIIYGASNGLRANDNPQTAVSEEDQFWTQNSGSQGGFIEGLAEFQDVFGSSLAAGDFNGDGKDDLAIGVPGEGVNDKEDAGAVNIIYGSSDGLTYTNDQIWHQNMPGVRGEAETGDQFGHSLAVGDFNNDGYDDLAVGVPFDSVNGHSNAGLVNVLVSTLPPP